MPQLSEQHDTQWVTRALAFSPDGRYLATYPPDSINAIQVWDISALDVGPKPAARSPARPAPSAVRTAVSVHLRTLPWACVSAAGAPPARPAAWVRGGDLPLALAHDLGHLLTTPPDRRRVDRPAHLPTGADADGYLGFLRRVAAHPLSRDLPARKPPLTDPVVGAVLARLADGTELPERYRVPTGAAGVTFARHLAAALDTDPARVWADTPAAERPDWNAVLPATVLAQIEANLRKLDRREIDLLARYGPPAGADPRQLADLLALADLPEGARLALDHGFRLLPRFAPSPRRGAAQAYPEGGYEGLATRGSLDSLLPTELAYDPAVFLHRVLNGEALYYGRERPPDRRRELAYVVAQTGPGLGGDGDVLARAALLALSAALTSRGFEVLVSLAGRGVTDPRPLAKPADIARVLLHREPEPADPARVLRAVLGRLTGWRDEYRRREVFWVLSEDFDADAADEHAPLYHALRAEAGQRAWFVRVGGKRGAAIPSARHLGPHEVLETELLWADRPRPAAAPAVPPAWERHRDAIESAPFRDGVRDVLHFTHPGQRRAWQALAAIGGEPTADEYLRGLAPPGMVYVAPGRFPMGSPDDEPDARDDEKPRHWVALPGYYIDRHPVTNGQFRAFVAAGGYADREFWAAGWDVKDLYGWAEPRYWRNPGFTDDAQPVVGVSWYEAAAYARWAGKALPSEAEWEKAAGWDAAAGVKRKYPWGDEWPDGAASTPGPPRVGSRPGDDSAAGAADLVGVVSELCRTRWEDAGGQAYRYPYAADGRDDPAADGTWCVARGCPWRAGAERVRIHGRCAARSRCDMSGCSDGRGFRCAARPAGGEG